mmetsp:Transcript_63721/g.149654  ORF Transcript_63721/g.149654 Transcript_63721/m.149654 type:complete len:100 (-) Transcript_63721:2250-2549(-)
MFVVFEALAVSVDEPPDEELSEPLLLLLLALALAEPETNLYAPEMPPDALHDEAAASRRASETTLETSDRSLDSWLLYVASMFLQPPKMAEGQMWEPNL